MFTAHLDRIGSAHCAPELIETVNLTQPGHHVLLTFDDGGKSALQAADELERRGWKGHFFIITARIGQAPFLGSAEVQQLRLRGHVIGSHSHNHPSLFRELPPQRLLQEWQGSRDWLEQLLGEPVITASVPGGDISEQVLDSAVEAGFKYLFTSEPSVTPGHVRGCAILGRFVVKRSTSAARVGELARLRGWGQAMLVRRVKAGARLLLPGLYRRYVRHVTAGDDATSRQPAGRS
jgi:peptidoglycan/xylan/chitin deacetylase (PgdA/CDA1 family)